MPRRSTNVFLHSIATVLLVSLPCWAQTQDPPGSAPSASQDSSAPSAKKQSASGNPQAATSEKKKPKKVWTNDELGSVSGSVSVVGEASAANGGARTSDGPSNDARRQMIESYRSQIRQAQEQIDAADKRIAQLKNFKANNTGPAGGINPNQGYNMVPLEDQVRQLEDKKKKLQGKIDDIENDARKNGIEAGEIR